MTPPTPEEIAKALQRIQEREIQEQTFHDTLVDSQVRVLTDIAQILNQPSHECPTMPCRARAQL